ncbi:MAG: cupin domain-containing protein [Phycisphaeraceae bacterium]|nr:cupin domain-containing protein [Phycisphaeraceae bacterium]
MKSNATRKFRAKLAADQPVFGLWVTLESASITEMAVALGLDWVVIDAEHGHLDWKEIVEHIRAGVRSDTVILVRIAELSIGLIKRALDLGADGVVVPWIESVDELEKAISFARYPPEGLRGIGAERATCWGRCFTDAVGEANDHVLVVPIIETVKAGKAIEQLCRVEGTELFFLGPADYSSTAGFPGQWEGPGVAEELLHIKDVVRKHGKHCGVVATSNENLLQRRQQGFRALALGLDGGLLLRSITGAMAAVGKASTINPQFTREGDTSGKILDRPPENFRPDRPEVMNPIGSGKKFEIARGVSFECLVGAHNQARNLTTGIVTFAPEAELPYHSHTFSESITLLTGRAMVEIEGRRYTLGEMDNVVIPRGLAHHVINTSLAEPAKFHVAMATDQPSRTLVDRFYSRKAMPDSATGLPGAERINRYATTRKFEAAANAMFMDYFNRDLMPGIEMSGGYGLFQPTGRLPAHIHDFDESICIVQGVATCVVEGRKYLMSDDSTALQPRGRVHYFINESRQPMAMLWVYAGPVPERLVVDENNATVAGNPWK